MNKRQCNARKGAVIENQQKTYGNKVLVAVVTEPGLAQEGGVTVKPLRGGVYVQPKQVRCGGSMTLGVDQTFTSPNYPNNYNNRARCKWKIETQNPDDTIKIECSDFDVQNHPSCRRDKLIIREGGVEVERFCGTGSKVFYSWTNKVNVIFRSNWWGNRRGFSCTASIMSTSTDATDASTEENTTPRTSATTPRTSTTTPGAATTTPRPPSSSCRCGVANPSRIVGGQNVDPKNKYPWQVGLKITGGRNYWCGGSIINNLYVLTAAHCFFDRNGDRESDEGLVVGVGDHNMYLTSDDVNGVTDLKDVEKVTVHPSYDPRGYDHDMALIRLKEPLDLSNAQVGPVCLPKDDSKTYEGVTATASGWGTTSSGGSQPPILNEVNVPILAPSCWGKNGVTENMLCAGLRNGGKDTCQGDSGGPLFVNENSRYVQVGVTSWGNGCANARSPGVYARVSKFLSWINENTADATSCQ